MLHLLDTCKAYVRDHKKPVTASLIGLGVIIIVGLIALFVYGYRTQHAYAPIKACSVLTPSKAMDLLGDKIISTDTNTPVVSGNTATSKCGYTDENADQSQMRQVALAVQSAINKTGISETKNTFTDSSNQTGNKKVTGVGDAAFFSPSLGQLDVLDGRAWLIISYGVGATPQANDLNQLVKLAKSLLPNIPQK